jgi:hypothetical protein
MKSRVKLNRRKFISNSVLGSIGTIASAGMASSCAGPGAYNVMEERGAGILLRPWKLLCAVCTVGEGDPAEHDATFKAIRENPDIPVRLICDAGDVFTFQDPGSSGDSADSAEFNRKRDLEILQRIDLTPGVILTARIILHRIWDRIENVSGICTCSEKASTTCSDCPKAQSGFYEKGREISLLYAVPDCGSQLNFSISDLPNAKNALIVPRTKEERAEAKIKSLEAMYNAEAISVRPHILMCAICQYGGGTRPPLETDNLPEMLQFILKNPKAKIRLANGADWMICAPCPSFTRSNACVNIKGHGGLSNQLRDVRVLQKLELGYGDVVNAREMYHMIFERIPSSATICGSISKGVSDPSVWDDACGHHSESLPSYTLGREQLLKEFGFSI